MGDNTPDDRANVISGEHILVSSTELVGNDNEGDFVRSQGTEVGLGLAIGVFLGFI